VETTVHKEIIPEINKKSMKVIQIPVLEQL
jgi:hypothetical protein